MCERNSAEKCSSGGAIDSLQAQAYSKLMRWLILLGG